MTYEPRKMSELEYRLFCLIRDGLDIDEEKSNARSNALTWLRRNGFIKNIGTRRNPEYIANTAIGKLGDAFFSKIENHPQFQAY